MTDWDEVRTALHVARAGTVSAAAEALGVHHATVIRHVDALEARLGAKLFQRHARGYAPTEAGRDLLLTAQEVEDRLAQLAGRIRGQGEGAALSGELVVTSLAPLSPCLAPILVEFQEMHPEVALRYVVGPRLLRLEAGEAHVAIRAGTAPQEGGSVVQPFLKLRCLLAASRAYLDRHGFPDTAEALARHRLVGPEEGGRGPFNAWLADLAPTGGPPARVTFRVGGEEAILDAVLAGAGIGFVSTLDLGRHPDLVEVRPPRPAWEAPLSLVTHVDLHRTPKVQAFLALLKARAAGWG